MSGNVWEWCQDDWHDDYKGAPTDGRAWLDRPRGGYRVIRGGSWSDDAQDCRVVSRNGNLPPDGEYDLGFRLCRSL